MIDLIIIIVLLMSLAIGIKRGFVMQLMNLVSFVIALIVALMYYKPLAQKFVLWIPYPGFTDNATMTLVLETLDVDRTFYRVLAFALIFFVVKFAVQLVVSMFDFLTYLPVVKSLNRILGAALCFVEFYLLLFIILYVLALIPVEWLQVKMSHSILGTLILEHTPIVTAIFQKWWYIYMN